MPRTLMSSSAPASRQRRALRFRSHSVCGGDSGRRRGGAMLMPPIIARQECYRGPSEVHHAAFTPAAAPEPPIGVTVTLTHCACPAPLCFAFGSVVNSTTEVTRAAAPAAKPIVLASPSVFRSLAAAKPVELHAPG